VEEEEIRNFQANGAAHKLKIARLGTIGHDWARLGLIEKGWIFM
jgi:hypothetical protein